MHITIDKPEFIKQLNFVRTAMKRVDKKNKYPYVVLTVATDGKLTISGTNKEFHISKESKFPVDAHPIQGSCIVKGESLHSVVAENHFTDRVSLAVENDTLTVAHGFDEDKYLLPTLKPGAFARFTLARDVSKEAIEFTLRGEELTYLLDGGVSFVKPKPQVRDLDAVCLEVVDGKLVGASTDGLRLVIHRVALPKGAAKLARTFIKQEAAIEIMKAIASEVKSAPKPVRVFVDAEAKLMVFKIHNTEIVAAIPDLSYPDYKRVLVGRTVEFSVAAPALISALKKAEAKTSAEHHNIGYFDIGEKDVSVMAGTPKRGKYNEVLNSTVSGKPLEVAYDVKALLALITYACTDTTLADQTLSLEFQKTDGAIFVSLKENKDALYVMMGLRDIDNGREAAGFAPHKPLTVTQVGGMTNG